jgi:predicted transcriptional regulator
LIFEANESVFYNEIVEALKEIEDVEINKDSKENVMSELIINCHFVPSEIFDSFLNLVKENLGEIVDKIKDSFIDF